MSGTKSCGRKARSQGILTAAVAAALGGGVGSLQAQVSINQISNTDWAVTDGSLSVTFDPQGEEITSIQYGGGENLLNPGGGTDGSLNAEFAGTPFGSGDANVS